MSGTGIVVFNWNNWAAQYPVLSLSVTQQMGQNYFNQATLFCDNSACSPIQDASVGGVRESILYMLVSHIATLFGQIGGNAPSPLVGRISNASEGSVSVAVDMPSNPNAAWFNQTPFGAMAWQAMAPYRQARYIPPPQLPLAAQSWPGRFGALPFNGGFPWP